MSAGRRELNTAEKLWFGAKAWLRDSLVSEIAVVDGPYRTVFLCENRTQAYRAMSLFVKQLMRRMSSVASPPFVAVRAPKRRTSHSSPLAMTSKRPL